ncbi:MAG: MBL fold metallo-hydrolase [Phycisphaerae bacterium]
MSTSTSSSEVLVDAFTLGPLETNTYVVRCGGECWVIDPAWEDEGLMRMLRSCEAPPSRILLTHGHGDHIAGAEALRVAFPTLKLCCPAADAAMLADPAANMSAAFGVPITTAAADELIEPSQVLVCGSSEWKVLDTSGHTEGSVSYHCRQAGVVFTGDALLAGAVGRTDFPGGSIGRLLKNIRLKLMSLPDSTRVLAGHGPETSIGGERIGNPFLKEFYKSKDR